jgi:hypothetical protein
MPFTSAEKAVIYEILGLPRSGHTVNTLSLVHYPFSNVNSWNPTWNVGDMTSLLAAIDAAITATEAFADTVARVQAYLAKWDDLGGENEMRIESGQNGVTGVIVDSDQRRVNIRLRVANLLGISVPAGGYLHEIEAVYGKSLGRITQGHGDR